MCIPQHIGHIFTLEKDKSSETSETGMNKILKVKNDHQSKLSNLSNWKEAWQKQGTRDLRDTGAMLYQLRYEASESLYPLRAMEVANRVLEKSWLLAPGPLQEHMVSCRSGIYSLTNK